MSAFLPYGRQTIEDDDIDAVVSALRSDYLTTGPMVDQFEKRLAEVVGAEYAIVCNSGTAALHLAALALDLGPGDDVIVPTVTFVATANAPRLTGANIVFADVDPESGLITPKTFEQALQRAPRAKACFPVHLNGQLCDMRGLAEVAAAHGVVLVEDACHAIGAREPDGARTGSCANAELAAFSFHPVKSIAMGEGGAITTNDPNLARKCRLLRSHGLNRDSKSFAAASDFAFDAKGELNPWAYDMAQPGYNYRAPDILCALGLSQLAKLDRFLARRAELAARYDTLLLELSPVVRPALRNGAVTPGWHLYVALIEFKSAGRERGDVIRALGKKGVGTQVHYIPVHRQPYYIHNSPSPTLAGAERYYEQALSLPLYPSMSDDDVEFVVHSLAEVLGLQQPLAHR